MWLVKMLGKFRAGSCQNIIAGALGQWAGHEEVGEGQCPLFGPLAAAGSKIQWRLLQLNFQLIIAERRHIGKDAVLGRLL